jgi:hypothetical protein
MRPPLTHWRRFALDAALDPAAPASPAMTSAAKATPTS